MRLSFAHPNCDVDVIRFLGLIVTVLITVFDGSNSLHAQDQTENAAGTHLGAIALDDRERVILINPVVVADNNGANRASFRLPKRRLDELMSSSDTEVLFLDVKHWHSSDALAGQLSISAIAKAGRDAGVLCEDSRVLNILFVNQIATEDTRSQIHENVAVVALGGEVTDDSETALLEQITAFTKADVSRSHAVLSRIHFHSVEDGKQRIVDESWEPYLEGSTDNFLRFSIGLPAHAPVPKQAERRLAFARSGFSEKVREFTEDEKSQITSSIKRLTDLIGDDWPAVARMPWHFIKVDRSFCNGYPHTRGLSIVLTAGAIRSIATQSDSGLGLLLHEKLHVLQRVTPSRFEDLYRTYGFHNIELADGELERIDVGQNPDAFRLNWALNDGDRQTMLVTVFNKTSSGRLRFTTEYRELTERPEGGFLFGNAIDQSSAFREWRKGFGMSNGLDHPNEVSAYLSAPIFRSDYLSAQKRRNDSSRVLRLDQTRDAFRECLKLVGQ